MKRFLFLLPVLLLPLGTARAALLAGAAKVVTTPKVEPFTDLNGNGEWDPGEPYEDLNRNGKWDPVWMAGYRGDRAAMGVHDDLTTRALAVTLDKTTVLFISVDAVGYLFDEIALVKQEIKRRYGIPAANILLGSTHDHSGPDTIGLWGRGGQSGLDPAYMEWLRGRILECVDQAMKDRRPAKIAFGRVRYGNPIEDSRPPKVINDLLLSLRAVDGQGRTIAVLCNYAMHAEVLNESNHLLTADYPGVLRDEVEKHFGGTALFFPADIGGMQSPFVLFHSFWSCRRVGVCVADKVIESLEEQAPQDVKELTVNGGSILFPVDNPRFLGAIQKGLFGNAARFIRKEGDKLELPSDLAFIRLGPALFATLPGELFPELGNVLRSQMKTDYPFVLGLCNNEIGYIVPLEEWNPQGYEESMSLGPRTGGLLLDALFKLIPR